MGPKELLEIENFLAEQHPSLQKNLKLLDELCLEKDLKKEYLAKTPNGITYKGNDGGSIYYSPRNGFCLNLTRGAKRDSKTLYMIEEKKAVLKSLGFKVTKVWIRSEGVEKGWSEEDVRNFFHIVYPILNRTHKKI